MNLMFIQSLAKKRRYIILLAIVLSPTGLGAQENALPNNAYTYTKNNFSIGYSAGLNRTQYALYLGVDKPEAPFGFLQELNFTYTFQLKRNFSLSIRGGYGFYPFVFNYKIEGEPLTPDLLSYFNRTQYSNYVNLSPVLNYSKWYKGKWLASIGAGGGLRIHANETSYLGGQFGQNWWAFYYAYGAKPKTYFLAQIGMSRLLKNQDFVGLKFAYNLGVGAAFSGAYELNMNNTISRGDMVNKGNYFCATIDYTFTRARKWSYIETNFQKEKGTFKQARKQYKKERRFIDPKNVFIGPAAGGSYLWTNAENDPYFKSSYHLAGRAAIEAEIGVDDNKFFEFAVATGGYATGYIIKTTDYNVEASTDFMQVYEFRSGFGIRLINQNGYNPIDVSGGFQIGYQSTTNDDLSLLNETGAIQYNSINNPNDTINVSRVDHIESNITTQLFIKAGKNFRITNYLYFSANVQYNLGLIPISTRVIEYEINDIPPIQNELQTKFTGTGLQFLFGLKYKFIRDSN